MNTKVTIPEDLVRDVKTVLALRRLAVREPEPGDAELASREVPVEDQHGNHLYEVADDLAIDIVHQFADVLALNGLLD